MNGPGGAVLTGRHGGLSAASRWRLPFSRQGWRGPAGSWLGAGAGSSLDFQDHRNYLPGDDPRHIHWQAYARTGALTMKLYRAEVSPMVDIAVDVSASMTFTPAKALRTEELLAFCVASADRATAPLRIHAVAGRSVSALAVEHVRAGRWRERLPVLTKETAAAVSAKLPWRAGALKVLISDLLFPGDPVPLLGTLTVGAGIGVVLVPTLAEEADLTWRGNAELTDCETSAVRRQRVDETLAGRYREAYARHFSLWREACRKRGVLFARIPCEGALSAVLGGEALSAGAVEAIA
jgi:uncharacterized protein (DUF58 family)